ncbi:hypothetical protein I6F11_06040 [Ensifer sp. NBAIM29]|nr:hypothetical protein [Ensifer sp. NBAIM29]
MFRFFLTACTIITLGNPSVSAVKCLSDIKVSDFIVNNSVGVVGINFSHVEGVPNSFVFKLRNGKVFSVTQEGQCVVAAEVITYKDYIESTIEGDGECDGCGE